MRTKYYAFSAFTPKNLAQLTEEWLVGLPEELRTDAVHTAAHDMGKALADRLCRDEDYILNVSHEDFTQACLTLMGGASVHALGADGTELDKLHCTLCAGLYSWMAAKLYHKDSGKTAKEIVDEAMAAVGGEGK